MLGGALLGEFVVLLCGMIVKGNEEKEKEKDRDGSVDWDGDNHGKFEWIGSNSSNSISSQ